MGGDGPEGFARVPVVQDYDPDEAFEIDHVIRAEKVGGKYRIWLKWKDHVDPSPVSKAQLLRESSNPELLAEVELAMKKYREEHASRLRPDDDDDVDDEEEPAAPEPEQLGRGHTKRSRPQRFTYTHYIGDDYSNLGPTLYVGLRDTLLELDSCNYSKELGIR